MSLDDAFGQIPAAIGRRVRDARTERGWTLDQLAERSLVSRRMIVNVEASRTNASISTLLRLASALHVTLAELVADNATDQRVTVSTSNDREPLWRGEAGGSATLVASADTPDMLELWEWTLQPKESYTSEAHHQGTRELLHVLSGQLRLTVGVDVHDLHPGDGASFAAAVPHEYACLGHKATRFTMTVFEPLPRVRP